MKKYYNLILLATAVVLLTTGWGPLGCEGIISGRVIDTFDRPVNGATVSLYIGTFKLTDTVTDNDGTYAFENVVWGRYDLMVEKSGCISTQTSISLGDSYSCSAQVPDIIMSYDNESDIEEVYDNFLLGIKGNAEKLNTSLHGNFTLSFTGVDGAACTKDNFCQNCPVPDYVEFNSSNLIIAQESATLDVTFRIIGKSNSWWSTKLNFVMESYIPVPSWKISGWEVSLVDFKPSTAPDKGWADPLGSIEYDSQEGYYRWAGSW